MDDLLAVLKQAMDYEQKIYDFYMKASEQAKSSIVSAVLTSLAFDEKAHENMINQYYKALENGQGWPSMEGKCKCDPADERLAKIAREVSKELDFDSSYLKVYETALEMEKASYDYYKTQGETAQDDNIRNFFAFLSNIEYTHIKMLSFMVEGIKAA